MTANGEPDEWRDCFNDDTKFAEIKEYKELLDSGIITPEEIEKKKSELLDLSWNHNRRASWNQEALFLCP